LLTILACLAALGLTAAAEVGLGDFGEALSTIRLENPGYILGALDLGLTQDGFPAEDVLEVIERLAGDPASPDEKEAILRVLAQALYEGLPIHDLVSKTFEGLARRIPLPDIQRGLEQRMALLIELRDLLYAVGIFSTPSGTETVPSALPEVRFNHLLMNITDAVADYIEGGGSPLEGHAMYEEVRLRLTMLAGSVLPPEDVRLALERIDPSDLTRAALAALT
jgi:hypothetical protein